jgi:hypothetical protein
MSADEVRDALKEKNLPVFGTNKERLERLKKAFGVTDGQRTDKRKGSVVDNIDKIKRKR